MGGCRTKAGGSVMHYPDVQVAKPAGSCRIGTVKTVVSAGKGRWMPFPPLHDLPPTILSLFADDLYRDRRSVAFVESPVDRSSASVMSTSGCGTLPPAGTSPIPAIGTLVCDAPTTSRVCLTTRSGTASRTGSSPSRSCTTTGTGLIQRCERSSDRPREIATYRSSTHWSTTL